MFVLDMTTEKWVGNKNEGNFIDNLNWSQIEEAIRAGLARLKPY